MVERPCGPSRQLHWGLGGYCAGFEDPDFGGALVLCEILVTRP